jgi:hypothetical protein
VRRSSLRRFVALFALASALAAPLRLLAQEDRTASLPAMTAEFLLRFARFTEWPAEILPPDSSLVFCTTDPSVAEALAGDAVQTIGAHTVSARLVQPSAVPRECNVLHLAGLDGKKTSTLIAALPNRYVLTVGDTDVFTEHGGVIRMYVEDGHVNFVVNLSAAERARLHLSSKMLSYARKIVRQ